MRGVAFAFITLVVGSLAGPTLPVIFGDAKEGERLIVAGQVKKAVEQASQSIKDAGLDPFDYDGAAQFELPVPVLFAVDAFVDALTSTGLSDIVVNRVNYNAITNRLTFNISLPRISFNVAKSGIAVVFFGDDFDGAFSGSLDVIQPRVVGDIRLSIGIISGVTIRRITLVFSLGRIESKLNLEAFGVDLSNIVNTYLGKTLPAKIDQFAKEINELLEALAWMVVNNK